MDFLSLGGVGETKSLLLPPAVSGCSRPIREGTISDKPEGRRAYRIATLALDIVGLIDATGRDRAAVVGHDWGGAIAWWLATYHADRVPARGGPKLPPSRVFPRILRRSPAGIVTATCSGARREQRESLVYAAVALTQC
jgi:pimeloyl-ACP methyl ester carboxylesterase